MSTGTAPRWPGPGDGYGLGERLAAGLLVAVVGLAFTTWLTAAAAAVLFGDGPAPPLGDAASALAHLPGHLSDPRAAFPAPARGGLPGPVGFYAAGLLVLGVAVIAALLVLRGVRWARDSRLFATAAEQRGNGARWARRGDLRSLAVHEPQPGRVTLGRAHGRLVAAEERQSAIVIAPTQSLKTTGLAVPAILEWDGPVLATSVKTDLLRDTIDRRHTLGDVLVFDPTEATGLHGASWSPLVECQTWHGAQRTAAAMCATAHSGGGLADADFWYAAAAKLLGPVLLAAATVQDGSMADVVRWVDTQEVDEVRDAPARARRRGRADRRRRDVGARRAPALFDLHHRRDRPCGLRRSAGARRRLRPRADRRPAPRRLRDLRIPVRAGARAGPPPSAVRHPRRAGHRRRLRASDAHRPAAGPAAAARAR